MTLPLTTDWRVFAFACAMAVGTCAIFGVVPAFRATRAAPVDAMKSGGRGATDGRELTGRDRDPTAMEAARKRRLLLANNTGHLVRYMSF